MGAGVGSSSSGLSDSVTSARPSWEQDGLTRREKEKQKETQPGERPGSQQGLQQEQELEQEPLEMDQQSHRLQPQGALSQQQRTPARGGARGYSPAPVMGTRSSHA